MGGYALVTGLVLAAFAGANLALVYAESDRGRGLRASGRRALARLTGRSDVAWLDWVPVSVGFLICFGAVVAYGFASGAYACTPASDAYGLLASGRALWAGGDPFHVTVCDGVHEIPYGFGAVLVDGIGSLGGIAGIYVVWGLVALSLVPLAWAVAGADRRWVLLYLASSLLFLPLVSAQIDGASNAIVPATVLLALALSARRERLASVLGGFLSTARFPNLFVELGASGAYRRYRATGFAIAAATFGLVSVLSYWRWGASFLDIVFLDQLGRRSFSLNLYGVLLLANALPASIEVEAAEALLTVALVVAVFLTVRSPIISVGLVLTGIALLTPFLSFDILVWLLPVALVGRRARAWLWAIGVVGAANYEVAYLLWARVDGLLWPSAVLDVVLTLLLLALFVELWRAGRAGPGPAGPPGSTAPDG